MQGLRIPFWFQRIKNRVLSRLEPPRLLSVEPITVGGIRDLKIGWGNPRLDPRWAGPRLDPSCALVKMGEVGIQLSKSPVYGTLRRAAGAARKNAA